MSEMSQILTAINDMSHKLGGVESSLGHLDRKIDSIKEDFSNAHESLKNEVLLGQNAIKVDLSAHKVVSESKFYALEQKASTVKGAILTVKSMAAILGTVGTLVAIAVGLSRFLG